MDIVDIIQSILIATAYYKHKDGLSINVLVTKNSPLGSVEPASSLVCRP